MEELFELVSKSPELQQQVLDIFENYEGEALEAPLVAFAREQGFNVTVEEACAYFVGLKESYELSEEELDMVAGGKDVKCPIATIFIAIWSVFYCIAARK